MQKIKEHYSINLEKIPAIGDSTRDLEAYSKSEAQPILVRTGNGKDVEKRNPSQVIP
jgi:D-glycero-D-manno-heptose 1,7-bisphosphate phosphatase